MCYVLACYVILCGVGSHHAMWCHVVSVLLSVVAAQLVTGSVLMQLAGRDLDGSIMICHFMLCSVMLCCSISWYNMKAPQRGITFYLTPCHMFSVWYACRFCVRLPSGNGLKRQSYAAGSRESSRRPSSLT